MTCFLSLPFNTICIDCIDLLTKIFVVNPRKRITLSDIRTHPWMNKGYEEPIQNYLPRRPPIETLDMNLIKGMDGFGLGSPQEIKEKLASIITSPAYQSAAQQIDKNFQKKENDDQEYASRPRWRRSLSSRKKTIDKDDFRTLPAMYDPLISIYYLVKERKESDERKQKLLNAQPIGLQRSTSTRTGIRGEEEGKSAATSTTARTTLTRRRTYDTSKKLPDLPSPATPIPSSSSKTLEKPTRRLLRKKSLQQAAKMMGINLDPKPKTTSTVSVPASSPRKSNWLKLELNSQSAAKLQQPRQSLDKSQSIDNQTATTTRRKSVESMTKTGWKRLSVSRTNNKSARFSFDDSPPPSGVNNSVLLKKSISSSNMKKTPKRQPEGNANNNTMCRLYLLISRYSTFRVREE